MTEWNHGITTAPREGRLWLATKCGKVFISYFIANAKDNTKGRWAGLATGEQPVAWLPFVTPTHPTMAERLDAAATEAINNLGLVAD